MDSEANFYKLHVAGYSGNAGDSLSNMSSSPQSVIQNGMNFTTYDADNDLGDDTLTCAVCFNAGFWFNNCGSSCLTGTNGSKSFTWLSLQTYANQPQGRLRAVRIMIRSI